MSEEEAQAAAAAAPEGEEAAPAEAAPAEVPKVNKIIKKRANHLKTHTSIPKFLISTTISREFKSFSKKLDIDLQ